MSAAVEVRGRVYAIDGNVDTDTIIKSRHCTTGDAAALAPHCLAELDHAIDFAAGRPWPAIACAGTFGIGSARVHAPLALAGAGVKVVIARAFAPIFFENCLNGAHLLPVRAGLDPLPATGEEVQVRIDDGRAAIAFGDATYELACNLPAWALRGEAWMEHVAAQASAAGGLEALRQRGLDPRQSKKEPAKNVGGVGPRQVVDLKNDSPGEE